MMHQIKPTRAAFGTPRDRMAEQLADVANALESLERLMGVAAPNGRDYHDQNDYQRDADEAVRRMKIVAELARQYWAEAMEVQE
jgi:uncharacterized protein (DUF4213/DUF364 family)